LPEWGIVKCGTGSFDGKGYKYNHREFEDRGCGEVLITNCPPP